MMEETKTTPETLEDDNLDTAQGGLTLARVATTSQTISRDASRDLRSAVDQVQANMTKKQELRSLQRLYDSLRGR